MKLRLSDTLNSLMLGGLLMASTFASADNKPTKPYWQDVQVVAVNKEYPRSSFMTYENRANALTGKFEKSKYYQLLNGTWKFYFVDSYKNLPANITDPAISTADWADIKVPGNWEVQGHGVAIYTNHGYEFQPRNPQPPTLPEANPVGVYRRDIDIPADWDGRDIYLHLAGAKSGVYVYINGQEVEMYKFGSTTREHSYPISLQAVWTADNGKLPPWKGDYHHDLNTQLSYWPTYTGNHLTEGMGYLNTLWNQRDAYKRYTRRYFDTEGMNIPGVCTLTGEPMGGWIQYSMSQTVAAWLAQHFYLQWKYSADRTFLKERAYPFIKDVAIYLEQISEVTPEGVRKLEFSSSPEIFDNSLQAWFSDMTNYDLAMMHFLFKAASELAHELNLADEAGHWASLEAQLPDYDIDEEGCLTFAKGYPYKESHRHFSHAMAIHPLGLIDWSDGEKSQHIIRATLKRLDEVGPDYWTGYSYSWLANMKARAFDGEGAAQALKTFAECFCLKNTFHANGDQTQSGKSRFTYRPFTLEGNFAFAAGIQEMLLQSHTGVIRIFPAIPKEWKDVSFESLRAMGAFLVSARMEGGEINRVRIYSEKGGMLKIARPGTLKPNKNYTLSGTDILNIDTQAGEWIELNP